MMALYWTGGGALFSIQPSGKVTAGSGGGGGANIETGVTTGMVNGISVA